MFPVKGAIFAEFQFFLDIAPVFLGGIISPFTFAALQRYQVHRCLFACHTNLLPSKQENLVPVKNKLGIFMENFVPH
jgi:hypothetical protein